MSFNRLELSTQRYTHIMERVVEFPVKAFKW